MTLTTLKDLYLHELSDLLDAERQLIKALPKMAKAATSAELRKAFENHLSETEEQAQRLEEIFSSHDVKPKKVTCKGMKGLLEEGQEAIDEKGDPSVKDALLIAAAQRVEHYEMAGYGCVKAFAMLLGDKANAKLLQATLDEEKGADQTLSDIAEKAINVEAAQA